MYPDNQKAVEGIIPPVALLTLSGENANLRYQENDFLYWEVIIIARNARKKSGSGFYHVIIRGNGKQILFENEADYVRFRDTMKRCLEECPIQIHAYCLMENHVHLLVRDLENKLDFFMKKLEGSYAFYYNHKYERIGHLFQDRYKSEPVENDAYFAVVLRYILQNPQKAGVASLEEYPWNSYSELINKPDLTRTEYALEFFGGKENLLKYIQEPGKEECMEPSVPRLSDESAQQIIHDCLNFECGTQLQNLSKDERNVALHILKQKGLSIRQIERLTGISRKIVQKA